MVIRRSFFIALVAAWCITTSGCNSSTSSSGSAATGNSAGANPASGSSAAATAASDKITAAKGARRIIILTNGNSPFWDTARAGVEAAAKDLKLTEQGLTAAIDVNDGTPQGQIDKLRQYVLQDDVVGVGVSVIDAANASVVNEMKKLRDRGVHVVTVDSDVDRAKFRDARYAFIGTDNLAGGKELGAAARNLCPEGGAYVTFVGRTGAQNAIERVGGFEEGAGEKFKNLDNMGDDIDRTRARDNVRNAISNHPDLNVLVGIWSYNAPAIVDVVTQLNRRAHFTIVAFDAEPLAIKAMAEGYMDAMVVQNPFEMGNQGVRLLTALVRDQKDVVSEILPKHGQPEGDIYDTGLKVVVPDGDKRLTAEKFGPTTTFLTLSAFNEWLAKYKLTGS